jgi:hypothetical protein
MDKKINNARGKLIDDINKAINVYEDLTYGDIAAALEFIKYELLIETFNNQEK